MAGFNSLRGGSIAALVNESGLNTKDDVLFAIRYAYAEASGGTLPSFLSASVSGTTVNLSWTNPGSVSDFNLYQNGVLLGTVVGGTTYAASGLAETTAYSYTVQPIVDGSPVAAAESNLVGVVTGESALSYLNATEAAQRDAVIAEMANNWNPDVDSIVWDDTVNISSELELYNFLNGTAVGGVTINTARNQRVLLTTPFTNNRSSSNDRLRGKDWLAAGKMLFIESDTDTVALNFQLRMIGTRGVYFRNVEFSHTVSSFGGDPDWAPGANTITITGAGTGFTVGEILTLSDHGNMYEPPVLRVDSVDGGGGLTSVVVDSGGPDYGVFSGTSTGVSVSSSGSTSNGTLTIAPGVNPRDTAMIDISRTGTFSTFPVIVFDSCRIGSGYRDSNPYEWLTAISSNNCEQLTLMNCSFYGYQTANKVISTRRFSRTGCDYQSGIGDMAIVLNTGATTSLGGVTFTGEFGDGYSYHYAALNTSRNLYDDSNATTASGKILGLYLEHTDFGQHGTSGDSGPIYFWAEFNAAYLERSTYRDAQGVRYSGGTQGSYNDDTNLEINGGTFSNIIAATASATYTGWNADTLVSAYDTSLRVGQIPPNGDGTGGVTTNLDVEVGFLSRQKSTFGGTSDHYVRKGVHGQTVAISGSGYVPGNLTSTDNSTVTAVGGASAYSAAFPTLGAVDDAQGRMSYAFTDDGVETQAAFRSRLYAAFGQSGVGAFDPTQWIVD